MSKYSYIYNEISNQNKHLVFVYGTLKYGNRNYYNFLTESDYIGDAITCDDHYQLYCNGSFPMTIDREQEGFHRIKGEIFEVNDHVLRNLDMLESNGHLYTRKIKKFMIDTMSESVSQEVEAWIYLFNKYKGYYQINNKEIVLDNGDSNIVEWKK
jgi:gamma-glutamylcyclotransferase (GGCT)/AIG2-like uncharacterized protein YtfP